MPLQDTLELQQRLLEHVEAVLDCVDPETGMVSGGNTLHRRLRFSYPLAYLYATDFEGNRFHGDEKILKLALAVSEASFATQCDFGGFSDADEIEQGDSWSAYYLIRTAEMLGPDTLGTDDWAQWKERIGRWVSGLGARPFFFCSPNHEGWKTCTLDLAGRVFDERSWCETAAFQVTQLLKYQMPQGYWEENRHHGPSMSYNYIMAEPLHLYWLATGREDVHEALERLVNFMARYALPDGSTSGALDGRVTYSFARTSPSCSVTPQGNRLNELGQEWAPAQKAKDRDVVKGRAAPTPPGLAGVPDKIRFLEHGPSESLGAEQDGWTAEDHDANLHALSRRQGAWHTILSGVFSDIPKESDNVYRMERQNRVDLWHRKTGLLLGGGSMHRSVRQHLANFFIDTGYFAEVNFGRISASNEEAERATFYPRVADTTCDGESSLLKLTFAHAQADLRFTPRSDSEFAVDVQLASSGLKSAWLGLPLMIFGDTAISCGDRTLSFNAEEAEEVAGTLEIGSSRLGPAWQVVLPESVEARLHAPVNPANAHKPKLQTKGAFGVALLTLKLNLNGPALPKPVLISVP